MRRIRLWWKAGCRTRRHNARNLQKKSTYCRKIWKIYPNCGDEKTLLKSISKGDIFGISNLYTDAVFPSIIVADKRASVLFIDGNAFKTFIENDANALKSYLQFLSKKIVYLNQKIATLSAGSSDAKLALYLFEHSNDGKLQLDCSMSELANTLGVGRASLYRSLDRLTCDNIIERNGFELKIADIDKLSSVASKYIPPVIN